MSWMLVAASAAALLVGGAVGAGLGLGGAYETTEVRTVAGTVVTQHDTVTKTTTVKKRVVKTVTRTVTEPPPYGSGSDDGLNDDEDEDGCSDSYEGACLDPSDDYNDVDCGEIYDTDFDSIGDDPYGLDRDVDGVACESY
jgi:hypothetical protein